MTTEEPQGTFACPICGVDSPHSHSEATQAAYREEQISGRFYGEGDGWIRTELRKPKERGWYLCLGVEIDADQFGKPKDIWERHDRWSQLSWFKWVRQGGARGHLESDIPEVLYYDPFYGGWQLRNLLGNAVYSGAENRHRVQAEPKYWRELPPFIKRGTSEMGRETANDPDRGKTFVTGVNQPARPDERLRYLDSAGVERSADVPAPESAGDALQPAREAVRDAAMTDAPLPSNPVVQSPYVDDTAHFLRVNAAVLESPAGGAIPTAEIIAAMRRAAAEIDQWHDKYLRVLSERDSARSTLKRIAEIDPISGQGRIASEAASRDETTAEHHP